MGHEKHGYVHSVVPYREDWPELYAREAELVKNILQENLLYLEHVGSTAIVGFSGNPVMDIVATVKDLKGIDHYMTALKVAGYEEVAPPGIVDSRFFKKDVVHKESEWRRLVDLYFFPDEHPQMVRMVDNRDYLLAHPDEARKYEEANKKLIHKYSANPEKYDEKKTDYLKELSRRAAKWRGHTMDEDWGLV